MYKKAIYALTAALVVAAMAVPAVASTGADTQFTDILGQGGEGVAAEDGAKLKRHNNRIRVVYRIPTPEPDSYTYPTAAMVPPGSEHPEVVPGYPEVFTLWGFVFNYPDLCDGPCDSNDIGDTAAQGGAYQLGATVAVGARVVIKDVVKVGDAPFSGVPLQNPRGAEVHVALAPHGQAQCGDELLQQLGGPIGNPTFWWPALFFPEG